MYFLEDKIGRDTPPAITHQENFYGFLGVAFAWQVLFLVLSTDPVRYRPMILPSILEKVTWGTALIGLLWQGRLALFTFETGAVDWVVSFLFLAASFTTKSGRAAV